MTKDELIDETLRQGINAGSRVKIVTDKTIVGKLTDAKVYTHEGEEYIGIVLEAPKDKILPPIPVGVRVIEIISLTKL